MRQLLIELFGYLHNVCGCADDKAIYIDHKGKVYKLVPVEVDRLEYDRAWYYNRTDEETIDEVGLEYFQELKGMK